MAVAVRAVERKRLVTGSQVWDSLWAHHPDDAKDATLLAREIRSPRWSLVVDKLTTAFGSVEGLRTIELGCGRGDLSVLLAQKGAQVALFDRSEIALREARRRFARLEIPATFHHGDFLEPLNGHRSRFDVALSLGVIEHFRGQERTRVLGVHHDVLRPGGMAVISVPNAWCLPYRLWKSYLELRGWWPYGMEQPYAGSELRTRSRQAGFTNVETHALGFWQSISDHWIKRLWGRGPDWVNRVSRLDASMGFVLLAFGRRPVEPPHGNTPRRKGARI